MNTKQIILTTAIGLIATPALASGAPSKGGPNQTVYCIKYELETGSRLSRQECMTKKQWAQKGVNVDELLRK